MSTMKVKVRRHERPTAFRGEAPQGLPSRLPEGERLLWQGVPDWRALALRVFHVRGLALYFSAIFAACAVTGLVDGAPLSQQALSLCKVAGAGMVPVLVLGLYSWGVARSTVYSITNKRVCLQLGLVLPMTINLPFARVESAALRAGKGEIGDICLSLTREDRLAYLMLWPHARPWQMARAEPMLRCVPDSGHAAQILARALAASANLPVPAQVHGTASQDETSGVGAHAPVAA